MIFHYNCNLSDIQGHSASTLTNTTSCQIEIRDLVARLEIETTVQSPNMDHDLEGAEYLAMVRHNLHNNVSSFLIYSDQ